MMIERVSLIPPLGGDRLSPIEAKNMISTLGNIKEILNKEQAVKIETFEVLSKEDSIYQELLEQYKTNPEVEELLDKHVIPPELVLAGDFRIITVLDQVINSDLIKIYLVKDIDTDAFLWVIGKWI